MKDRVIIRPYADCDEESIKAITIGRMSVELADFDRRKIRIAEFDGKIVGWSYSTIRNGRGEMSFIVVYVYKSFRRNGIGTKLYR